MSADPRSRAQRRRDTEHRLSRDIDAWVASASADGAPYLVPLSFDWDGCGRGVAWDASGARYLRRVVVRSRR